MNISESQRAEIQKITEDYAKQVSSREMKTKPDFNESNFGFNHDILGDLENAYPPLDKVGEVRRIVENEKARLDAMAHIEQKNSILRRNRERSKNHNVSRPFIGEK